MFNRLNYSSAAAGTLAVLTCLSCGGRGQVFTDDTLIPNAKVSIVWPARTRDHLPAPGSALSAYILAQGAGQGGSNVEIFITRENNVSLHTGLYPIGQPMTHSPHNFTSVFYSEANQGGEIVGQANGQITWSGANAVWTVIDFTQSVKTVKVISPTTVAVGNTPTQLLFEADGDPGHTIPVSPGSARWTLTSGVRASLTSDGKITASQAGTIVVQVEVDGIKSQQTNITATTGQVDQVTIEDLYQATGGAGEITVAASANLCGGVHYVNDGHVLDVPRACYWSQGVLHDIHPGTGRASWINAGSGGSWAGWYAQDGSNGKPVLLAGGQVNLSTSNGEVLGMSGTTQVGTVGRTAALWTGTSASYKSLHQDPWRESYAKAISGTTIAGYLDDTPLGPRHAVIWEGANNVIRDLHPSGASSSAASAVSGSTEGGYILVGSNYHAALWHGTANTCIDINPSIAGNSQVYGLSGDVAVGFYVPVINDQTEHACIWNGASSRFIDLNALLPADYAFGSRAVSIVQEPNGYMVVGSSARTASNPNGGRHPIIWHVPSTLLN